jgi:hypothetical protein
VIPFLPIESKNALDFLGFSGRDQIESVWLQIPGQLTGTNTAIVKAKNLSFGITDSHINYLDIIFDTDAVKHPELKYIVQGQDYIDASNYIAENEYLEAYVSDPRQVAVAHRSGIPFKFVDDVMRGEIKIAETSNTIGYWKPEAERPSLWLHRIQEKENFFGKAQYKIVENRYGKVVMQCSDDLKDRYLQFSCCKIQFSRAVFAKFPYIPISRIKAYFMGQMGIKTRFVELNAELRPDRNTGERIERITTNTVRLWRPTIINHSLI